jgi:dynactin complex subunit
MFDNPDNIKLFMQSKGYKFLSCNESNMNFIKPIDGSVDLIKAHVKNWKGPWVVELKFTDLNYKIELRSGNFSIGHPEFDLYEKMAHYLYKSL